MVVCDGLKGLPDSIGAGRPEAITQTCVVHLLRASFRYAASHDWDEIARALKPPIPPRPSTRPRNASSSSARRGE